uniref:Uncharacterized protein n=1 Tax=Meloidogyne enterolobii TaxID=390850 RepID=A0A6V7UZ04_MELEN|nr:unnamed protein product [Meloidogyne enterolobii]
MAGTEGYNQQTGGVSSTIPLAEELRGDLNKIIFNVSKLKSVLVGSKVINELETQLKNFSLKSKSTQDRIIQGFKNTNMFLEFTAQERSFDLKESDFEKKLSNLQSELNLLKSQCVCQQGPKTAFSNCNSNKISDQIEPGRKNPTSSIYHETIVKPSIRRTNSYSSLQSSQIQKQPLKTGSRFLTSKAQNFQSGSTRSQTTEYFNINKEMSLNQLFELNSDMVHTGNKLTGRGREYTFTDENREIIVVELIGCGNSSYSQHCLLYEYPESVENEKINFLQEKNFYQVYTPGLEFPGQREEFIPNSEKMSLRPDGSYSLYNKENSNDLADTYLQVNAQDFKLRRFNSTKEIMIVIPVESSPGDSIYMWLCVGNSLMVKHVRMELGNYQKTRTCFSLINCKHNHTYNIMELQ